jgi:hypothetical protein
MILRLSGELPAMPHLSDALARRPLENQNPSLIMGMTHASARILSLIKCGGHRYKSRFT